MNPESLSNLPPSNPFNSFQSDPKINTELEKKSSQSKTTISQTSQKIFEETKNRSPSISGNRQRLKKRAGSVTKSDSSYFTVKPNEELSKSETSSDSNYSSSSTSPTSPRSPSSSFEKIPFLDSPIRENPLSLRKETMELQYQRIEKITKMLENCRGILSNMYTLNSNDYPDPESIQSLSLLSKNLQNTMQVFLTTAALTGHTEEKQSNKKKIEFFQELDPSFQETAESISIFLNEVVLDLSVSLDEKKNKKILEQVLGKKESSKYLTIIERDSTDEELNQAHIQLLHLYRFSLNDLADDLLKIANTNDLKTVKASLKNTVPVLNKICDFFIKESKWNNYRKEILHAAHTEIKVLLIQSLLDAKIEKIAKFMLEDFKKRNSKVRLIPVSYKEIQEKTQKEFQSLFINGLEDEFERAFVGGTTSLLDGDKVLLMPLVVNPTDSRETKMQKASDYMDQFINLYSFRIFNDMTILANFTDLVNKEIPEQYTKNKGLRNRTTLEKHAGNYFFLSNLEEQEKEELFKSVKTKLLKTNYLTVAKQDDAISDMQNYLFKLYRVLSQIHICGPTSSLIQLYKVVFPFNDKVIISIQDWSDDATKKIQITFGSFIEFKILRRAYICDPKDTANPKCLLTQEFKIQEPMLRKSPLLQPISIQFSYCFAPKVTNNEKQELEEYIRRIGLVLHIQKYPPFTQEKLT